MRYVAGSRGFSRRAREFDSPRGHMYENSAYGLVGMVCVFFSVGGLIGGTVASILVILWQDAGRK